MLNVLHLINYPGKGGTEKYILSLAERLHGNGCTFYLGHSEDGPMLDTVRQLGIETIHIPMKSPYDFRAAIAVKETCRKLGIDIIHTHFLRENYISIISKLAGNKAAVIYTHHMLTEKNAVLRMSNKLFTAMDDRIIAVSRAVRDMMVSEGISPSKIEVIYNGVDCDYWTGQRSMKFRKEFGISEDDFVITSAARFSEEKGHAFLLEAIKDFKGQAAKCPEGFAQRVKFVLVGDGELLEKARKLAAELGISDITVFTGYRTDIRNILLDSDLYVSHSKSESLGISILEALACGLPVVSTDSGGPSEIINGGTGCGILIKYGDTESFAGAVLRLVTDKSLYAALKSKTVKTVKNMFSLEKTAGETYNLYKSSLAKSRKAV